MSSGSNYDWLVDVRIYHDLIRHGDSASISYSVLSSLAALSNVSSLSINLLDFQGTLRSEMLGSSPDLTGSAAIVKIKLNSNDTDVDNLLTIYTGKISNYTVQNDVMCVTIKNTDQVTGDYPQNLLSDSYDYVAAGDNVTKPLQYGDFLYATDVRYFDDADAGKLAECPLIYAPGDTGDWGLLWIADHEMHSVPTSTDFDQDGAFFFVRRDGLYVHCEITNFGISNSISGCYAKPYLYNSKTWVFKPPTEQGSSNVVTYWQNAADGKSSTYAVVDGDEDTLHVKTFDFSQLSENVIQSTTAYLWIALGDVVGDNTLQYSVDSGGTWTTTSVGNPDSNKWKKITLSLTVKSDINDVEVKISWSGSTGDYVHVKEILVAGEVQGISADDKFVYVRCKGRKYSGTWNSRKTIGDLIENPADMIESILRDEFGQTNINTDGFDNFYSYCNTNGIVVKASIMKQMQWKDLLADIMKAFNVAISYNMAGTWALLFYSSTVTFTGSGSLVPGYEDIFSASLISGNDQKYKGNPILRKSFELKRTPYNNKYDIIRINYYYVNGSSTKYVTKDNGTGDKTLTVNNRYIGDSTSANAVATLISLLRFKQVFVAVLKTFYNAIGHELGDVINIRHDALSDAIVSSGAVTTQKWLVVGFRFNLHPAQIQITALEMS